MSNIYKQRRIRSNKRRRETQKTFRQISTVAGIGRKRGIIRQVRKSEQQLDNSLPGFWGLLQTITEIIIGFFQIVVMMYILYFFLKYI